jgi:hypothetical protein
VRIFRLVDGLAAGADQASLRLQAFATGALPSRSDSSAAVEAAFEDLAGEVVESWLHPNKGEAFVRITASRDMALRLRHNRLDLGALGSWSLPDARIH